MLNTPFLRLCAEGKGVSEGSHVVYVKATDNAGNSKDYTRSFSVASSSPFPTPTPSPSPSPTLSPSPSPSTSPSQAPSRPFKLEPFSALLIVAGIVIAAIVVMGLRLYFRKRGQ